jgi:hypothetical protein
MSCLLRNNIFYPHRGAVIHIFNVFIHRFKRLRWGRSDPGRCAGPISQ